MKNLHVFGLLLLCVLGCEEDLPESAFLNDYDLIFQEEFEGTRVDRSFWSTGMFYGETDVSNEEDQYFTEDALRIEAGILKIKADFWQTYYDTVAGSATLSDGQLNYTSGAISTYKRFSIRYGRMEVRARFPKGQGLHPVIGLLPYRENARFPQIRLAESFGDERVFFSNQWLNFVDGTRIDSVGEIEIPGLDEHFREFAVEWSPSKIEWFVDRELVYKNEFGIPSEELYPFAFLAIGGKNAGYPDPTTPFPAFLEIDYIRVFKIR